MTAVTAPVWSRDVAAVLVARDPALQGDPVKLNALLYLCQAWSLACSGQPMFEDAILAGPAGPVVTGTGFDRVEV